MNTTRGTEPTLKTEHYQKFEQTLQSSALHKPCTQAWIGRAFFSKMPLSMPYKVG